MNHLFNYDRCPLCQSKLDMNVLELDELTTKVIISYFCPQTVDYYSEADKKSAPTSHFAIRTFKEGDIVTIALYPYLLNYNLGNNTTAITKIYLNKSRKYITTLPLLDIDYNNPYATIARLDKLLIFS